jgi:excisionase family DNA binding protein
MQGFVTVRQAAERLGLSIRRVQELVADNRLPGAQLFGNRWAIPEASVAAFRPRPVGNPNFRKSKQP